MSPVSPGATGCAALDIEQFEILRIFPDIQPVAVRPFASDGAGVADAVPVIGLGPVPGGFGGGAVFGAEMADDHAQLDPVEQPFGLAQLLPACG